MPPSHLKPLTSLDIVVSIYNQERLIPLVLAGILNNTTTPFNLILIFDGCTDQSQKNSEEFLRKNKAPLLKNLIITTAENVYETRANNIGFRIAQESYLITVQDDVVIEEKGWERRLTYPLRAFDDIFAVTGRAALTIQYPNGSFSPEYLNRAGREFLSLPRNTFAIRNIINRGPIAFRNDTLKKLGYLDELFAPGQFDEADLVLRAREQYGMKSGVFSIDYRSDLKWGKTRTVQNAITSPSNTQKNAQLLLSRHQYLSFPTAAISEERVIGDGDIDYTTRESLLKRNFIHARAAKRFFFWYLSQQLTKMVLRLKYTIRHLLKTR